MQAFMKKTLLRAALVSAFGVASAAHAGVVIDLFTDPVGGEQSVSTSILNATVSDQNPVAFPTSNVIGGYRDLSIKKTFDSNVLAPNSGASTLNVAGGQLSLGNDPGNRSTGVVTWDGMNNAGALGSTALPTGFGGIGIDLTVGGSANGFLTTVFLADLGFAYDITVWDMDGDRSTLSATAQFAVQEVDPAISAGYLFDWFNLASGTYCDGVPQGAPPCADPFTELFFEINSSAGAGSIDFTRIGALQLVLKDAGLVSTDFAIGSLQTVPEPGALALTGLALLGAALAGRKRIPAGV